MNLQIQLHSLEWRNLHYHKICDLFQHLKMYLLVYTSECKFVHYWLFYVLRSIPDVHHVPIPKSKKSQLLISAIWTRLQILDFVFLHIKLIQIENLFERCLKNLSIQQWCYSIGWEMKDAILTEDCFLGYRDVLTVLMLLHVILLQLCWYMQLQSPKFPMNPAMMVNVLHFELFCKYV